MKSQSIRVALLSAVVLASPLLTFAGSQFDKLQTPPPASTDNTQAVVRSVQQGKGTGMTRPDVVIWANAWRVEPASQEASLVQNPRRNGVNYNDTQAFHK